MLFPDIVNAHSHTVGHLFPGQVQHLLTNLLGEQQTLRLIADSMGRIKVGSLRQVLAQAFHQLFTAHTPQGAETKERTVAHQAAVAALQFCGPLGGDQVLLVETHHHRSSAMAQQLDDIAIPTAWCCAAVHEQQHQIYLANGGTGHLHQVFPQQVVGLVNAGGVQQHQLGRGPGQNAPQAVAGCLGHRGGDGHLVAHQLVEQGGLAHVGSPDQGHKAGAIPWRRGWGGRVVPLDCQGSGLGADWGLGQGQRMDFPTPSLAVSAGTWAAVHPSCGILWEVRARGPRGETCQ